MKDYYKILGVEEQATEEDIKKQYRTLSKKYHPDVNPEGAETFKEIAEAYDYLGNSEKRKEYDIRRKNPFNTSNFDNFFANMFNMGNNPFNQQRRKTAPDKIVKLNVTPTESYLGSEKTITYFKSDACNSCKGTGGDQTVCSNCGGSGAHIKTFGTGFMVQQIRTACETCGGKGYTLVNKCYYCDGRGTKQITNEVRIKLPHGIDDGQFLKLERLGDFSNGTQGDLVIQIVMVKDSEFEKINNDLIYNLFLNHEELKNDNYTIKHPSGDLIVNAPKQFDSTKPLRLKGKGYNGGDMYVKLNVRFERT
jgi:molecular chaperone DnaJ